MARTKRMIASYGSGHVGFSDAARQAAAKARSDKHTQELQDLFVEFKGNGKEEFRVAGVGCQGLRYSIEDVNTDAKMVTVATTDPIVAEVEKAQARFENLPYRSVVHSPLEFLADSDTDGAESETEEVTEEVAA